MRLENIVIDAVDPARLGRFWSSALGAEPITEGEDLFEARLVVDDGPWLDLCFPRVGEPVSRAPQRLHLDLLGGRAQQPLVERLLALGATRLDIGQRDVPWVVMADPEGNAFCVMEEREAYSGTGAIAALPLDSADPRRDARFWAALTGWVPAPGHGVVTLRHPSGRGPLLELCLEPSLTTGKNSVHLDLRVEAGEDEQEQVQRALALGATRVTHGWGDLPWTVLADPSGNELCLLTPSRSGGAAAAGTPG